MDVLVGCSNGVNKIYNIHKKTPTGIYGSLNTSSELNVMTYGWDSIENNEDYVLYGYSNGILKYWNQKEKQLIGEIDYGQSIKAIHTLNNDKLLVALENGLVDVKTLTSPITTQLTPMNLPTLNKKKSSAAAAAAKNKTQQLVEPVNTQSFSLNVANNLSGFAMNSSKDKFAFGGKEVNLTIWDLEKQVKTYVAKFKHDFLNLQEPVSINVVKYMDDDKILTGNGFKVKAYDLRSKSNRSSFLDVSFSKHPIQAIQYTNQREHYFYASDSIGKVFCYDVRTSKHFGSFKDSTGSVRDIAIHPTLPLLATVGLDRYLRVYDLDNRKMLHKVFLKQRLSSVLFSKEEPTNDVAQEDEEIWKNLEENQNKIDNNEEKGKKRPISIKVTDNMDSDDDDDDDDANVKDGDVEFPIEADSDDSDFGLDGSDEDISEFKVKKEKGGDSDDDSDDDDDDDEKPKRKTPAKSTGRNNKNNKGKNNNNTKKTSQVLKKKLAGLKKRK
ncbi:hypothetical protein RB653_009406 [Dictyostelium firmibasis]|uniref:WD40 repeat-containing protein n=1 Tax=Dictyostelium firmibasis TaxID=79012 RepID=A0AAN7U646_9MYCE